MDQCGLDRASYAIDRPIQMIIKLDSKVLCEVEINEIKTEDKHVFGGLLESYDIVLPRSVCCGL